MVCEYVSLSLAYLAVALLYTVALPVILLSGIFMLIDKIGSTK